MLESLHVHNFALLEDAKVEFTRGFNVFTGETGAGKSILIDAFSVVLGGRASTDYIRSGTDGFWVQAVFNIAGNKNVLDFLQEQGIEAEDEIFLKRMVNDAGKSKALINGVQVPLQILKTAGNLLVDIHGQHENQFFLKPEAARIFTDEFDNKKIFPLLEDYKVKYKEYLLALNKLQELQNANNDREHLISVYQSAVEEITNANLVIGEEEKLEKEAGILQHGEKIVNSLADAYGFLENEQGVLTKLADAKNALRDVQNFDERLTQIYKSLDEAWIILDDVRNEMGDYLAKSNFNEERVTIVQTRLDLFYHLQKKYGGTLADVIEKGKEFSQKLNDLNCIGEVIAKAEEELKVKEQQLTISAEKLTKARQTAAKLLGEKITEHIHDLAMPDGVLQIQVRPLEKFTQEGKDELNFLFSANKGEPLCELVKVASGGELSRLALAVKTVLLSTSGVSCMVFDEIDVGVGGVTAEKMAEKIALLSNVGQVLCITHLPQIAAFADRHIYIEKSSVGERTVTKLDVLLEAGKIKELVRMASGSNNSTAAMKAAEEMLDKATKFKKKIGKKK